MKVTVKLSGPLKKYLSGTDTIELQPGSELRDLLVLLGIPAGAVSLLVVNGQKADIGQQLKEGDRVAVYPPVCGG